MPSAASSIAPEKLSQCCSKKPLESIMKRQSKLTSRQSEQEQQRSHQESQRHSGQDFATVEEMLRHAARHTPVPANMAHRVQESSGPVETRPWWRRLFGS